MVMQQFRCKVRISNINGLAVVLIPGEISKELNSRGMVMVTGNINGSPFTCPLEPDGKSGHWLNLEDVSVQPNPLVIGEKADLVFTQVKVWPEPVLPADFAAMLQQSDSLQHKWMQVTPRAKWEWLRWIRSTANAVTRQKRINTAIDKLQKNIKRPCCFNSTMCTIPQVSSKGILLDEKIESH
jgi:hypothetical protein